ncbi:MAG TPA: hypothetical protein VG962_00640 [Steroidobacteraceae bacterium]|nr:hypothetical protein [Steroidobacteraceae bacterium]
MQSNITALPLLNPFQTLLNVLLSQDRLMKTRCINARLPQRQLIATPAAKTRLSLLSTWYSAA